MLKNVWVFHISQPVAKLCFLTSALFIHNVSIAPNTLPDGGIAQVWI